MDFSDYLRRKNAAPVYVNFNSNAIASSNASSVGQAGYYAGKRFETFADRAAVKIGVTAYSNSPCSNADYCYPTLYSNTTH
jgi:hypothetical protein